MSYERLEVSATIPTAATSIAVTAPLKTDWGALLGLRGLVTSGSDTSTILQIADGDGKIAYLDAAGKDYKTAAIDRLVVPDDTQTGLTGYTLPFDLTGVAIAAGEGAGGFPLMKSPLTITWSSGTAGETILVWVYYRSSFDRVRTVITVPNPAATVTASIPLPAKFTRVQGFRALASADTTSQIEIKDADSRIVYKDAADKDYTTAGGVFKILSPDDTLTGLTVINNDLTGAVLDGTALQQGSAGTAVVKSPLTVTYSNNATANATLTLDLIVER
jgi:hypothetical protein